MNKSELFKSRLYISTIKKILLIHSNKIKKNPHCHIPDSINEYYTDTSRSTIALTHLLFLVTFHCYDENK